ncbi:tRNA(Met) cytidine acetyltransferase TmcA [Paraglaciecola sp. L3A3]|uniref:tRNA(Met) cytidine acetyltransferase TmcA n=1 Tax=Paraglaciecola sp. L3A3 TaxID=2686358 RepID=UPI00131BD90E|nr:GNAT family N-acetyltransferase [Paraglaciecola sp. L3A3]
MRSQLQQWINLRHNTPCHRQLLVISGEQEWSKQIVKSHFAKLDNLATLWVGQSDRHNNQIHIKDYRSKLGHEYDYVILDAFDGFRTNAAMALSGTIKSAGLMVILCPKLKDWPNYRDPEHHNRISYGYSHIDCFSYFYQYLGKKFVDDVSVAIFTAEQFIAPVSKLKTDSTEKSYTQQNLAVSAIYKVAKGRNNRPLVITADRGRGKSSALGIAAAQLMQDSNINIIITAPHIATTEQVFHHTKRLLPEHILEKNKLSYKNSQLCFVPLDKLILDPNTADILLIDEAAAIPVETLIRMTEKYTRIVFSTTIHGYEGSGRGFEIRFKKKLAELKPEFRTVHLEEPIRWHKNDALEQFWFNSLCYQQTPAVKIELSNHPILCKELTKQQLVTSPADFTAICSLLINAHYQTSPDDIQRLLDAPESKCFVITQNDNILGVAQVNEEGGQRLSDLAFDISSGKRRLKGHLIAQNIASHYNQAAFSELAQWRISRIAIKPDIQGHGLGSQLLSYVEQQAKEHHIVMLTTAFGCSSSLLNFWHQNRYEMIKLSNKVEVSSGENNCMCVSYLAALPNNMLKLIQTEFYQEVVFQVDKAWQTISATLLADILARTSNEKELPSFQINMIEQFCNGTRHYTSIIRIARQFILSRAIQLKTLTVNERNLIIAAVVQNKQYKQIAIEFNLTGKKQIELAIKNVLKLLLSMKN